MSCLFCESFLHFSQMCDDCKSEISRIKAARSMKLCCKCFKPIRTVKPIISNHDQFCFSYQRCYICYANDHHTLLCEKPATQVTIPKIDSNLLSRFMQTFDPIEQIQFAFYSNYDNPPITNCYILNKPINEYKNTPFPPWSAILFNYDVFVENGRNFLDKFEFNKIHITSKFVTLKNLKLSPQEFLPLLTLNTIELCCALVIVTPEIKFSEILARTRNIKKVEFYETENIVIEKTWPQVLLENLYGRTLKCLQITIDDIDFDTEIFAKFIKQKTTLHAEISIDIDIPLCDYQEIKKIINKKFETFFIKTQKSLCDSQLIRIRFIQRSENMYDVIHLLGMFTLR